MNFGISRNLEILKDAIKDNVSPKPDAKSEFYGVLELTDFLTHFAACLGISNFLEIFK